MYEYRKSREDILDEDIQDFFEFCIIPAIIRRLHIAGFKKVYDVTLYSRREIMLLKGVGKLTVDAIEFRLREYDIVLKVEIDEL